jgi:predicted permease
VEDEGVVIPFWRRRRREAELDEEIRAHLALAARDHEARGEEPGEAARAARREFGNATLVKEITRGMWGGAWLDQLLQDLRLAARSLRRSPAFVVVAVLALGLGLGLSTAMFAVIDAALYPRQAYANADRIFLLFPRASTRAGKIVRPGELFQLIRDRVPALDAVVPYSIRRDAIVFGGEERDQNELVVPSRWFDVVGIRPLLGRAFTDGDGDGVAVVGYEVWRSALAGRRSLAGAHVTIGDRSYAVVGVLPRVARGEGALLPLAPADEGSRGVLSMPLVRLRSGASVYQASRELKALAHLLTVTYASPGAPWALNLVPWRQFAGSREEMDGLHLAMVASALAVLLIACVNLAHLMLARGLAKRRELAVRMALGVGRAGAVRVVLAEGALIAVAGVGLGAVLAIWGSRVLESIMPYEVSWPGYIQAQLSWRVFALGALAAVTSAVLFGLLPALRVAFRVQITEPLKDEGGTTTGGSRRRYSLLVIMEVALALILLMGGTLLLRSLHRLRTARTGFDAETLATAEVGGVPSYTVTPRGRDSTTSVDWDQVLATARAVPGVIGAALQGVSRAPGGVVTAEMGGDSTRMIVTQTYPVVTSNYLQVHGLPILRGRDFEPGDAADNGVAVLSSVAAARLYPRGDAVGRMLKLGGPTAAAPWVRIVGVARTPLAPWGEAGTSSGTGLPDELPVWVVQRPGKWYYAIVLVRTAARDPNVLVRLRHALRSVPGVLVVRSQPYTVARDASIAFFNFLSRIFVAMGAVGLGLAALGVYGVLAYAVARRMREFGVRIALGAEARTLFRMVMHDGLVMLLAGTGVGAFGALAAAPLFPSMSVGVNPTDVISLIAAEAVLLLVGLSATLAPAFRAVRANPLDIIRAV